MSYGNHGWKPYVPVAQRRKNAEREITRQAKNGAAMQPVRISGTAIARSFWGKGWCTHLEAFSDFENRLPRGRSYVRNGAVCHLHIGAGRIEAQVIGTSRYTVTTQIAALEPAAWSALKHRCAGGIGSLLELLQGTLSEQVMRVVTDRNSGLFPKPGEMSFTCSCPDWADMCKHVAATLYGVGNRLDQQPELLFRLRGVDPAELIEAGLSVPSTRATATTPDRLADDQLAAIFGVDFDDGAATPAPPASRPGRSAKAQPKARDTGAASKKPAKKTAKEPVRNFRATGTSVKALRRKLGLSPIEFAAALSVSPASVQRWESAGSAAIKLQARCLAAVTELYRKSSTTRGT